MDVRWRGALSGVVVAPSQILFTLAVRVVGDAGGIAPAGLGEEGASLGGDEGGVLCGGGGSEDGTAADAGIRVITLRPTKEKMRYTGKQTEEKVFYCFCENKDLDVEMIVLTVRSRRATDGCAAVGRRLGSQLNHMIAATLWTNITVP